MSCGMRYASAGFGLPGRLSLHPENKMHTAAKQPSHPLGIEDPPPGPRGAIGIFSERMITIDVAMPYTNCETTYQGHWM